MRERDRERRDQDVDSILKYSKSRDAGAKGALVKLLALLTKDVRDLRDAIELIAEQNS